MQFSIALLRHFALHIMEDSVLTMGLSHLRCPPKAQHRQNPLHFPSFDTVVFNPLCARHDAHAIQRAQRTILRHRRTAETVLCRRAPDESQTGDYCIIFSVLDDMVVSGVWGWDS